MPYGLRRGALDHSKPEQLKEVDFDAVWSGMLEPCIPKRFEAKRADTTGTLGLIDRVYIEWLANSEVVLADLTFGNPNVYYELGIRHALSGLGAVLVAQEGTILPFDLRNQTILFYDIWNATKLDEFRTALKDAIAEAEVDGTISPVHVFLPDLFVQIYEKGGSPAVQISQLEKTVSDLRAQLSLLESDRTQRLRARIQGARDRGRLVTLANQVRLTKLVPVGLLEELAVRLKDVELFDEAIEALDRAVAIDSGDSELFRAMGFAFRLKGPDHYATARRYFEKALGLNDADAELQGMIGGMHKRDGDLEKAREHYQRAYDLDPQFLYTVVTMGQISAALGIGEDSRRYYREVQTLCTQAIGGDDADEWTYLCLGEAHFAQGEGGKARSAYRDALTYEPPPATLRSAAESLAFLATRDVNPTLAHEIQEQILWPAISKHT